jgi:hypothetical protein
MSVAEKFLYRESGLRDYCSQRPTRYIARMVRTVVRLLVRGLYQIS